VNRVDHAVQVFVDIIHRELKNAITVGFQPRSPALVIGPPGIGVMRRTIDLDHQTSRGAIQISEVRPNGMLPPELPTI
jgi:hypothetical protein